MEVKEVIAVADVEENGEKGKAVIFSQEDGKQFVLCINLTKNEIVLYDDEGKEVSFSTRQEQKRLMERLYKKADAANKSLLKEVVDAVTAFISQPTAKNAKGKKRLII